MVLLESPKNILVLTQTGEQPTIFNGVRNRRTDIEIGQRAFNNADNIYFTRIGSKIIKVAPQKHAINDPVYHSSTITPGDIIDADENGLPHDSRITTASVNNIINASSGIRYVIKDIPVTVQNNYQYLVKDHLYIRGSGHLKLQGNAQLKVFSS
jgi:hypothetical protein